MLLQEHASRLQQVIAEAQSSAPAHADGSDSRGAVHVRLGPDGLPRSFRVKGDWNRRVPADAFAAAVFEACMTAARERTAAWAARLEREGWQSRVDQLRDELDQTPAGAADTGAAHMPVSGRVPAAFAGMPREDEPRSLHVLAEDALSAFDAVERQAASPPGPPQGSGDAADGRLVLTLSASSLVSCRADPEWVTGQTATGLTRALGQALAAARASLAGAAAAAEADAARQSAVLGQIFTEALELISSETRPPSRNGARHARVR
jgi:hypothetical protein